MVIFALLGIIDAVLAGMYIECMKGKSVVVEARLLEFTFV